MAVDTPAQASSTALPDALGPLSPSPDQQAQDNVGDNVGDVTMTSENEAEPEDRSAEDYGSACNIALSCGAHNFQVQAGFCLPHLGQQSGGMPLPTVMTKEVLAHMA